MPLTIQHARTITVADMSGTVTVFNSAGLTTQASATDLILPSNWNSAHSVTLSLSASEVQGLFAFNNGLSSTTAADGITAGLANMSFFEPFVMPSGDDMTLSTGVIGSWYFDPAVLPFGMGRGRINVFRTQNSAQFLDGIGANTSLKGGATQVGSFRNCLAFYSLGPGTDSTRLNSVWTGEAALSATRIMTATTSGATSRMVATAYLTVGFVSQINTAGLTTSSAYTISGSTSSNSSTLPASSLDGCLSSGSGNRAYFTGSIMDVIPFNTTLPAGNYWVGHMFTTHLSGSTAGANFTSAGTIFNSSSVAMVHYLDYGSASAFKAIGRSTVGNTTTCPFPFHGVLLTATSNATASFGTANIVNSNPQGRLYWNFIQDQFG